MSSKEQDTVRLSQILNPDNLDDDDQSHKIAKQFMDQLTGYGYTITELMSFDKKSFTKIVEEIVTKIDTYEIPKFKICVKICAMHKKRPMNGMTTFSHIFFFLSTASCLFCLFCLFFFFCCNTHYRLKVDLLKKRTNVLTSQWNEIESQYEKLEVQMKSKDESVKSDAARQFVTLGSKIQKWRLEFDQLKGLFAHFICLIVSYSLLLFNLFLQLCNVRMCVCFCFDVDS